MGVPVAEVLALAVVLGGCGTRVDLHAVPIEGGTAAQHDAVAEELAAFERWIGPDRVALSGVEFERVRKDDASGWYHVPSARIHLWEELDPREVRSVLRHELCHAVDFQEDLLNRSEPAFDALVRSAEADPDHPLHHATGHSRRGDRAEVLAYLCQRAPLGTALLAHPCPYEPDDQADAARWIAEHVWSGEPDVSSESAAQAGAPVSWDAPSTLEVLEVFGSEGADAAALVSVMVGEPSQAFYVSTVDGSAVPRFLDVNADPIEAGYATEPPYGAPALPPFDPVLVAAIEAVSDGETTARIVKGTTLERLGGGRFAPHVLAGSDGSWSVVDGACPTRVSSVFLANGELYVAWADGTEVLWAPLE